MKCRLSLHQRLSTSGIFTTRGSVKRRKGVCVRACVYFVQWLKHSWKFYILLTVHHVMILGKGPTWRTIIFYVFISIYNSLHVSSTSCSSSGVTNCVNTTSGNCHSVLAVSRAGWKKKSFLPTCTHLGHQHRMKFTRGCIDTICLSWWWARCARNM